MTGRPLRVGLIGLGEVVQLMHLPLLSDDPRFRIEALADASPSLSERLAARYRAARRHASAEALIDDPGLDAVFILTPDHLHAPLLERAIRARRHVFVEKPAALTAGELRPLAALARESPAIAFVGYMLLFDYGRFTALYEAVIHEVARFDAGIEVLTADRHFRIGYDTPYIRFLPTRLEVTTSGPRATGTEIVGPFHEDPFRRELDAFHHAVMTGEPPKTTLEDSLADLDLLAEVGRHFLAQDRPGAGAGEATDDRGRGPRANQGGI